VFLKISRTWKMSLVSESPGNISPGIVFVKFPGPGKSWKSKCKVLESDADAMTQAAGAEKLLNFFLQ